MRSGNIVSFLLVLLQLNCLHGVELEHKELHQSIISFCHALPFSTLLLKNRCLVQREDVECAEILAQCQAKFPEFTLMDSRQLEPAFVKHVQKLSFFKNFRADSNFCVLVNGYECPPDFFEFNGLCYRVFPQKKTHAAAKAECAKSGSVLIEVHDDRTNAFLESIVVKTLKQPVWLGIERSSQENLWQNFNGTHLTEPIYFRWMFFTKGHTNALQDYGVYNGYWRSAQPTEEHPFVCQRKAVKSS